MWSFIDDKQSLVTGYALGDNKQLSKVLITKLKNN